MNGHSKKARAVQSYSEISEPVRRPSTAAGHLMLRYRIDPAVADLIASLAGFGSAVE
jgi:hypothetical protein